MLQDTIKGSGEFSLIERFKAILPAAPAGTIGIGDDCAVWSVGGGKVHLATTDMLIDGVHFLKEHLAPRGLSYKSLAVSLSDIAAMGGRPLYALLSLALPANTTSDWLDQFMTGITDLLDDLDDFRCPIIGGDTTRSDTLTISFTVIGEADTDKVKLRSAAKEGDIICVTGFLGSSKAGLDCILNKRDNVYSDLVSGLIYDHYKVFPHIEQGQWLAQHDAVHAMMDISDGLAGDIKHIMAQSNCGALIELNDLPKANMLIEYAEICNIDANEYAYVGGEDYCLLVTIAADQFEDIAKRYRVEFPRALFPIGRILPVKQGLQLTCNGVPTVLNLQGFDHFK